MADPSVVLSERFAGALADLDESLRGADPVVRRSDRADYQVNGSMALAKRTGRPLGGSAGPWPREILRFA